MLFSLLSPCNSLRAAFVVKDFAAISISRNTRANCTTPINTNRRQHHQLHRRLLERPSWRPIWIRLSAPMTVKGAAWAAATAPVQSSNNNNSVQSWKPRHRSWNRLCRHINRTSPSEWVVLVEEQLIIKWPAVLVVIVWKINSKSLIIHRWLWIHWRHPSAVSNIFTRILALRRHFPRWV